MAERILTDFIRALRSADVRVSTGEAIDAARAVSVMGYDDREALADTLRCVLAKSPTEKATHDRLFELYFSRRPSAPNTEAPGTQQESGSASDVPDLMDLIDQPSETELAMAMERAGQVASVEDIRFSTQIPYFAQQMMKAMGVDRLEDKMMQAFGEKTPQGEAEAQRLIDGRQDVLKRATAHARQAFETFGAGATEQFRDEVLSEKVLTRLDAHDLARMRGLVERIARRLAAKHSRRKRRTSRGQLDVRRTLRANAGLDGVPFDLVWKTTRKDKPKIVAICDVSGSVARVVRFFLMLVYGLRDVAPDVEAFAFSGRLEDVGHIMASQDFTPAMDRIVNTIGMSSTDYGQSLSDLQTDHWQKIDRRSTIIMLGDGRSNNGDPRTDLFSEVAARAKRTIWLCPEAPSLWGTGDSEIPRYRPYCDKLVHVATLKDLERVIDEVLAAYG